MSEQNLSISRFSALQNVFSQQRYWWLSFLFWLFLVLPGQAVELRIAIKDTPSQLKIGSSTTAVVKDSAGRKVGEIAAMSAFMAQPEGSGVALGNWRSGQLWVEPSGDGYIWIGDRWYRGAVHLVRNGNKLLAIDRVDLEEYLYSVVGAEAIPSWHLEALKAQAVAARTYALYKRAESKSNLYDLDTTTATQVYKGLESEYSSTHQAVNATAGEILTYNGKIILAVFHSSSGGHTENVEDIWSNPLPYLRGVVDYDQQAPVYQWTKSFSASELGQKLGGVGTVKAIAAERTTPRGRVVTMKVIGDRATKILSGSEIRQALGLRSTLFTVSSNGSNFQISGRGFGHGVGLSQWGAKNLAQQGLGYQQILSHYYQNTILAKLN